MGTFNSIEELQEWLTESKLELSDLDITPATVDSSIIITTSDETIAIDSGSFTAGPPVPEHEIVVKSLSEQPVIKQVPLVESEESDNIWYVDDYESIEGACSTSKVMYKGSTILMNVCESDGVSKVSLILEVDGEIRHVPFKLEKACQSCEDHDMIISL